MAATKAKQTSKTAAAKEPKEAKDAKGGKTERVNVWLTPEQVAWLKSKKNVSETVRALVTEAMNMQRLAESVKKPAKKK
ncbi:MAG: hypothetical protein JOZ54_06985 [Acidobacteria bacterium]|nr:hypothetical protein [Acidobacteriota bacterium]